MVGVVEQRQRGGPLVARNAIEASDFGLGGAVDEKAEHVVDDDGIVDLAGFFIRLAHEHDARARFGLEETFHAGDGGGLMSRNVFAVQVAGGKDDEDGGDEPGDHADLEKDAAEFVVAAIEQIERADGCHDEGSGDDGSGHVVHVLEQAPGIEQQLPEAEHFKLAVELRRRRPGAASMRR